MWLCLAQLLSPPQNPWGRRRWAGAERAGLGGASLPHTHNGFLPSNIKAQRVNSEQNSLVLKPFENSWNRRNCIVQHIFDFSVL